jgi:hypothetical protein
MTDPSFTTGKCAECGAELSMEVGITNYGPEGGSKLYCTPCAPNRGKGYTLADLEKWRRETQEQREVDKLRRQTHVMDLMGPDDFFRSGLGG